jgi:hypothetical protein
LDRQDVSSWEDRLSSQQAGHEPSQNSLLWRCLAGSRLTARLTGCRAATPRWCDLHLCTPHPSTAALPSSAHRAPAIRRDASGRREATHRFHLAREGALRRRAARRACKFAYSNCGHALTHSAIFAARALPTHHMSDATRSRVVAGAQPATAERDRDRRACAPGTSPCRLTPLRIHRVAHTLPSHHPHDRPHRPHSVT